MINKSRRSNFVIAIILFVIAAAFLIYGIYMLCYSIDYIEAYKEISTISPESSFQYVVSSSATYFGFAAVIFAGGMLLLSSRKSYSEALPNDDMPQDVEVEIDADADAHPDNNPYYEPAREEMPGEKPAEKPDEKQEKNPAEPPLEEEPEDAEPPETIEPETPEIPEAAEAPESPVIESFRLDEIQSQRKKKTESVSENDHAALSGLTIKDIFERK